MSGNIDYVSLELYCNTALLEKSSKMIGHYYGYISELFFRQKIR
jgi:hypothetical protein